MRSPFLGGAYTARSSNLAANRMVNLYPEMVETKEGKDVAALYGTPGLKFLMSLDSGAIRGMQVAGNDLIVVAGDKVCRVTNSLTCTVLGSLTTSRGMASILYNSVNGQIGIADGAAFYTVTYTTGSPVWAAVPVNGDTSLLPVSSTFQDGYGVLTLRDSNRIWQTRADNFNSPPVSVGQANGWSFATANAKTGNLLAIESFHRNLWVFGQYGVEIWGNSGQSPFAFVPISGASLEDGCVAGGSVAHCGVSLVWLSSSERGGVVCLASEGYSSKRISTHAVETEWASYPRVADAVAFSYTQEGHLFYVVDFVGNNKTWSYDFASGMWHERAQFENGRWLSHGVGCHAYWGGKSVVGALDSGDLYVYNLDYYSDNRRARKWLRSWRATREIAEEPVTFSSLRIDMETGIHVPATVEPYMMLRWSDDGGHTWSNEMKGDMGRTGVTAAYTKFNRLGTLRRATGFDRVFELSSVSPVRAALIGSEVEIG